MATSPYIGEIRNFAFSYAPKNWAQCNGQTLSITQNQALYAVLGTTYGGDGRSTFNLPNLQGRVPLHASSNYSLGQQGGSAAVPLSGSQIPTHTHTANGSSLAPSTNTPGNGVLPGTVTSGTGYFTGNGNQSVSMSPLTLATAGGGQPHENRQPYSVVNVCICLVGLYPPRS